MKELIIQILESKYYPFIAFVVAISILFFFGKSLGEFYYWIKH